MKVLALVDVETVHAEDPQFEGHLEKMREEMEFHIVEALRLLGHEVPVLPLGRDIVATIQALSDTKPDLVFNLTEHYRGDRRMDAGVAGLLELLRLPYTGTGPEGLMLCRDKATCKRILSHHHIRVPQFTTLPVGHTKPRGKTKLPAIVKPIYEDGSDGISLASLVRSDEELQGRARMIQERMKQPVICEEYVEGRELYVAIIGNRRLQAFPARELRFGKTGEGGPNFATAKVKRDDAYRRKWEITYTDAELPEETEKQVARISKRIYRLLRIRDYGRVDLRLTADGDVVFLEANPNPDLAYGEDLAEAAAKVGIEHVQLIDRIVKLAMRRQG